MVSGPSERHCAAAPDGAVAICCPVERYSAAMSVSVSVGPSVSTAAAAVVAAVGAAEYPEATVKKLSRSPAGAAALTTLAVARVWPALSRSCRRRRAALPPGWVGRGGSAAAEATGAEPPRPTYPGGKAALRFRLVVR